MTTTDLSLDGAQALVQLLAAQGVDCIFINPGTDLAPILEAIARLEEQGELTPRIILSLHEHQAMAAAHGHFMVSGRAQAVMVHVDLGTQNVGGALHNAWRGRAAVLLCAGRTPHTFAGELPGGRNRPIHWLQEPMDQAGIVRGYVKWDYELRRLENLHHVVSRAFQVALTEPRGPVYLTLPRELLVEKMPATVPPPEHHPAATTPQADPAALAEAARLLVAAQNPLLITAYAGRNPHGMAALVELAETLALPVVETRHCVNFPTQHPLHQGFDAQPNLADADVLLLVDVDVPYIPATLPSPLAATTIHLDIDPLKETMPLWCFPAHLSIQADSSKALPLLKRMVEALLTEEDRERLAARRRRLQERHRKQRQRWQEEAEAAATHHPVSPPWLAHCIGKAADAKTIFVVEAVSSNAAIYRYIQSQEPGTFFQSGGSSLGWGLGAALGAKLAAPERPVVCLVGDGAFNYSSPLACLWAATRYQAPFLTVIFNNSGYAAVKRAVRDHYPEGISVQRGRFVGADIQPSPRYDMVAQACGAYGERVVAPEEVLPALKRSLARVGQGQAAVLDVQI